MHHRRSRISRRLILRTMRLHHWRFTTYQGLIGRMGLLPYRRWLWSRWAAHRGLREQRRAERERREPWRTFKRLQWIRMQHYLDNAIYGYDTRDMP